MTPLLTWYEHNFIITYGNGNTFYFYENINVRNNKKYGPRRVGRICHVRVTYDATV